MAPIAPTILTVDQGNPPGANNFHSINDALTDATTGGHSGSAEVHIEITAGSYTEDLVISRPGITIKGANVGLAHDDLRGLETVIDGVIHITANGDNAVIDGLMVSGGGTVLGQKVGIYVAADDVSIANSLFDGPGTSSGFFGIVTPVNTTDGLSVTGNGFTGWHAGIYVNNGATDVTVTDNSFYGNLVGMSLDFPVTGNVSGNDFSNAGLEHIGVGYANGINAGATVGANNFDDSAAPVTLYGDAAVGTENDDTFFASPGNDSYDGAGGADLIDMSAAGPGGAFVDLNSGIAFSTATGIDSLTSFENVKGSAGNDGLYGDAGDNVFVASGGNDIIDGRDGSDTFDASAEAGPINANLDFGSVVNGADTATLTSVENIMTGAGADVVYGSGANNTIETGAGDDVIHASAGTDAIDGGAGMDSITFAGNFETFTLDVAAGTVTKGSNVTTFTNVEKLIFDDNVVVTILSPGDSIQDAVNAASPNDIIVLGAGAYTETVTISKTITILGANAGIGATGARGAESVLTGAFQIGAAGAGTTIDGLSIADGVPVLGDHAGIFIQVDDVSILNNVMVGAGAGANAPVAYKAIITAWNSSPDLLIDGNSFAGWDSGIYLNPGATATVTNNVFDGNGNAINNDGPDAVDISGNDFRNSTGAHTAFGVLDPGMTDLGAVVDGNTFDGGSTPVSIYVLGEVDRTVIGTDNADVFVNNWKGGGDSDLSGGLGDDTFVYSAESQFSANEVIDGGDGTDTVHFSSSSDGDTLTLTSNVTHVEKVKLSGTAEINVDASTVGNGLDITGNAAANEITGTAHADNISGGDGNDIINGGAGVDVIDGGDGIDTAVYSDAAVITSDGTSWTVTSAADGTETLSNIEIVDDSGAGKTYLVGLDGLATIQEALALAGDNDTILLAEGTYSGPITITQNNLTIMGVGDSANIIIDGDGSGRGISVDADNVKIENLSIQEFDHAIEVGDGTDDLTIKDVHISDSNVGVKKATTAVVNDLTIEGGSMSDLEYGVYIAKNAASGLLDGLIIKASANGDVMFTDIEKRGIYMETGSNVDITGITMEDVGATFNKGAGISINLLGDGSTVYENISISDFEFTNVGNGGGARTGITIKAQPGASVSDTVTISDGTITDTTIGILAGETGHAGPEVSISNVNVTGASDADGKNVTASTMTVTLLDGGDTWSMTSDTTGDVNVTGGDGADNISGGNGINTLFGGDGDDRFIASDGQDIMIGGADNDTVSYERSDAGVNVNLATGVLAGGYAQGDVISGIENITGSDFNDTLTGNSENNVLIGGTGDDVLIGGVGADVLTGGDGADVLTGGAGGDVLTGGDGADIFRFNAISESPAGNAALRDTITDFQQGTDVIDLAGIDANTTVAGHQAFTFVGTAAHTGDGATLRYLQSGGNTYVYGDVDADGSGDFAIKLEGLHTLTAASFSDLSIDVILGGAGADYLTGSAGAETIIGLGGNDTMLGNGGNDVLIGGEGGDLLTGGAGADVFKFNAISESAIGNAALRDTITDFEQGTDLIDLSGIDANTTLAGDQAFTFIGTAAHTGDGATLRYLQSGGNTYVYGDVDADGSGDFAIKLEGLHTLDASDFIL